DLLQQVRATALGAYAHQDVPFEQLVEALKPERHLSHSPLFQVMLALQNAPAEKLELPGLSLQPLAADHATAKFDLTLNITEEAGRLHCELEYNTDLFEAATIERMAGHFTQLLAAAAERPDSRIADLPMLEAHERRRLLAEWNATAADYPRGETIHQLFEAQAARTPDAIALVFEERLLSYAELNARANRLAHYLRGAGVGPDVLAGISVERSLDLVIAVLAILKAGGAYVPLDPAYPKDRLAYMLADAKPAVLLTQRQLADNLPPHDIPLFCMDTEEERLAAFPSANPVNLTLPDNLAYVIYTSGSTGLPKGVQLRHSGLANLIHDQVKTFGFRPGDRVLQFASFNFDASTWEIFLTLLSGATLCMATREQLMPAGGLGETLDRLGITIAILPPVGLGMLVPGRQAKLETVIVGGEACSQALVAQWAGAYKMFNAYGPTEITVCATVHRCDADRSSAPPIGRPIANTQVYILDADMNPVPIGVAGEVHIGGDGLARGYLNRADLSAEKFIPNPFSSQPGARMYRSGDLARWLPNGEIEYLGRIDHQVKIRGFRIELGEIETKLAALPAVRDAVVLAREDIPGDKRLVAYVVPQESAIPAEEAIPPLRAALLQSLPDFMVPAHFVFLDKLPLSPNGKVERKLLPAPGMTRSEVGYVAPRNPVEQTLAEIWAEVLSLDRVGVLDNFFNLGGHSMLAMQMISKVRAAYDTDLPIRSLFESPTVATLAAQLEQILAQRTQQQAERKAALEAQVQMSIDSMSEEEIIAMLMAKKREKNN
ncbi:MAG TPA: amino acid adenylation domain-containing protein, partial [Paucimonas sp.]|nr:amino acid adenylation domain-containing protein [Paucimonas sp.]